MAEVDRILKQAVEEPKTPTAEALLCGVVAGLHTRTPRSNPPAPVCPARSRQDCRDGGVSSSTPGLVTFRGSAAPHNPRNRGFFAVVASRGSLHCSFSGGSLDSPPRHNPDRTPPENLDAYDSCWDTDAAPRTVLAFPVSTSSAPDPLSRSRVILAPTDLCPIGAVRDAAVSICRVALHRGTS